jgi:hypothetical protein
VIYFGFPGITKSLVIFVYSPCQPVCTVSFPFVTQKFLLIYMFFPYDYGVHYTDEREFETYLGVVFIALMHLLIITQCYNGMFLLHLCIIHFELFLQVVINVMVLLFFRGTCTWI